jgi:thioredoxin-related protein
MYRIPVALTCCLLIICLIPIGVLADAGLPLARDLQQDAKLASRSGKPIMLMMSREHCTYCDLMKREILHPVAVEGEYGQRVILREMLIDRGMPIKDFQGKTQSAKTFSQGYGVHLTPTLLFLDPLGKELTEPIVGINTLELFGFYLDAAIEEAVKKLQSR